MKGGAVEEEEEEDTMQVHGSQDRVSDGRSTPGKVGEWVSIFCQPTPQAKGQWQEGQVRVG